MPVPAVPSVRIAVFLVLIVGGCATPQQPEPEPRPSEFRRHTRSMAAIEHRGSDAMARDYGVRPPARLPPLTRRILESLQRTALAVKRAVPVVDGAAIAAAREICRGLPPSGPPPASLVEFAMRSHGMVEPPPHMVIGDVPPGSEEGIDQGLRGQFEQVLQRGDYSRVGLALCQPRLTPQRRRLVVALIESHLRFEPIPRAWKLGERRDLRVTLEAAFTRLRLVVARPGGKVDERSMQRAGDLYQGSVRCERQGIYRVEVVGEGRFGSEVLANFPIYCGRAPPRSARYRPLGAVPDSAAEIEAEIVERTNALRRAAGLPPLTTRRELADVARAHSEDMRRNRFVGHVSPTSGNAADRVRRAGIAAQVVRENVARAYSAEEAMSELMNSPAHRSNILSSDVTEIGVGVAIDREASVPVLLVSQNFLRPPAPFDPRRAPGQVVELIRRGRKKAGVRPLRRSAALDRLARRYLATVGGSGQRAADVELTAALKRLGGSFSRVGGVLLKVSSIEALVQSREPLDARVSHLGLAIEQRGGAIWVFLLLGQR